jgi:hypothetical protein
VNLLGGNIDTINKNTETVIDASKEVCLEVNVEKTKYMLVSRDQYAGQNREIKIGNRSFENVSQFKYLGTTVTDQNLIQKYWTTQRFPRVFTNHTRSSCWLVSRSSVHPIAAVTATLSYVRSLVVVLTCPTVNRHGDGYCKICRNIRKSSIFEAQ